MRALDVFALVGLIVLAGCSASVNTSGPAEVAPSPTIVEPRPTPCVLAPVIIPTPPAEIPGYTELDPSTGLHVTGTAPEIDFDHYRLQVTGKVDNPLSVTYDDLRCMPKIEERCTLTCPGFFDDEATWAGASLTHVLDLAGVQAEATGIKLISADGYSTLVFMDSVRSNDNFLAYEWEGEPLPILHGFPVRAVFPALSGSNWAKWLIEIEVL
ncbi:MAG: molybdopterin-dependent oxidoreductase [Anaerolineae bacterium]|nr:molybdopterin-dependent oxidoreductase [Anaerolineae bacterium]